MSDGRHVDEGGALTFLSTDTGREVGAAYLPTCLISTVCWVRIEGHPALAVFCQNGLVGLWRLLNTHLPESPFINFHRRLTELRDGSRNAKPSCMVFDPRTQILAASAGGRLRTWYIGSDSMFYPYTCRCSLILCCRNTDEGRHRFRPRLH